MFLSFGLTNPVFAAGKGNGAEGKETSRATAQTNKLTIDQMIQLQANANAAVNAFMNAYSQSRIAHATLADLQKSLQSALKTTTDNAIATAQGVGTFKRQTKVKIDINSIKRTVLAGFLLLHPELVVAQNAVQVADANLANARNAVNIAQKALKNANRIYVNKSSWEKNTTSLDNLSN
jgi:hypothetical protein